MPNVGEDRELTFAELEASVSDAMDKAIDYARSAACAEERIALALLTVASRFAAGVMPPLTVVQTVALTVAEVQALADVMASVVQCVELSRERL